jgi:cysteinyl-tRNA synthetase
MYIYNSLTNKKEKFKTIEANKIKMYVCGPTVYNYIHIGNARPIIFFDVVSRYFKYRGYEVTYVSNITDVDDKIINRAKEENVDEHVIAVKYRQAFLENVKQLNCAAFDSNPSVMEYMNSIISFIEALINKGYAYEVNGDVYFSVGKISTYGQLSNQATENLEVGARISEHAKKESPLDFTLWKKTAEGIKWNSPWGMGRPGWHTECVAMINDTLGSNIDIHGGGSELKFPHHENEIAQSCALNHTTLANYWMHNGSLMIENEKMSKSLGNYIFINDFLAKYDFRVLRLFMLSTHYRQPLNYTQKIIENMKNEIDRIEITLKTLQYKLDLDNYLDKAILNKENQYLKAFTEAMDDDFNTANAITVLMSVIKEINKVTRKKEFTSEELQNMLTLYYAFNTMLKIFGIDYSIERLTGEDKKLISEKEEARKLKNFEKADKIRAILQEKGINI